VREGGGAGGVQGWNSSSAKVENILGPSDPRPPELAFKIVRHIKISKFFLLSARSQRGWASTSSYQWKQALREPQSSSQVYIIMETV